MQIRLKKISPTINHAGRSSDIYQPVVRGKLCSRYESKNCHASYSRRKQCFHQQEKQILITNQGTSFIFSIEKLFLEVEQILNKILHLPEAQQIWKAECLEIIQKKKPNPEENPSVTFDKIISESLTETLTMFTNTFLFKHHNPDIDVQGEEKKENANDMSHRQIQQREMRKGEVKNSLTESVSCDVSRLEMIPKPTPVEHFAIPKNQKKKEDPEPIHIIVPNDFKKELVLQIKDGKAKLFAQTIHEHKENQIP